MAIHDLSGRRHSHAFDPGNAAGERRTWLGARDPHGRVHPCPSPPRVREAIESDGDAEICDLHVWRVGRSSYAAVASVVAHHPLGPDAYRERVCAISSLAHVSIEVNRCAHDDCPKE